MDGYAVGQLARAFVTALTHADAATREHARHRGQQWTAVLTGMASGRLRIGGRTPIAGLPVWVTPEVVRGGFVTGAAAAAGPLTRTERFLARDAGVREERRALTEHFLGESGLAELSALLDSGAYRVPLPEQAALLTVAWLVRNGQLAAAVDLATEIRPFADRLSFAPVPASGPPPDPGIVHRASVNSVRADLRARRVRPAIARERRTLTVWNPLADAFLELWTDEGDPAWKGRARRLLERHRTAAQEEPPPRRHGDPGASLEILRGAAERALEEGDLPPADRSRVDTAVRVMTARRGRPGSPPHRELRERQAAVAAEPPHAHVAALVAGRLAQEAGDAGLDAEGVGRVLAPAVDGEWTGIPAGTAVPPPVRRTVHRARAVPVADLVRSGVASSAELLAELVPDLVAATAARPYTDPALRGLVAATLRAFARRRSLLLTDLSHQARPDELPWLAALTPFRAAGAEDDLLATARLLGTLVLDGFPGTPLPNAMIDVLRSLTAAAGLVLPWSEELAADIYTGTLAEKFLVAAELTADTLAGTPYARYYGLDAGELAAARAVGTGRVGRTAVADGFTALCERRAGERRRRRWPAGDVAGNGAVLEQVQILTAHNLVLLAGPLGVRPEAGWPDLGRRAGSEAVALVTRAQRAGRPVRTLTKAAHAWRQMLFHVSAGGPTASAELAAWAHEQVPAGMLREGLLLALSGEPTPAALRFTGWSRGPHPLLSRRGARP